MSMVITEKMIKAAQKTEKEKGIPTSVTLAQIIQESNSGGNYSGLATNAKNLFGEKGTGTAGSVIMNTTEYVNNKKVSVPATFKKFNSYDESIQSHANLLSSSRYTKYTSKATSVKEYAQAIQKAGYATDPNYSSNLLSQINKYDLNQYNVTSKFKDTSNGVKGPVASQAPTQIKPIEIGKPTPAPNPQAVDGVSEEDFSSGGDEGSGKLNIFGSITSVIVVLLVIAAGVMFLMKSLNVGMPSLNPIKNMTGGK